MLPVIEQRKTLGHPVCCALVKPLRVLGIDYADRFAMSPQKPLTQLRRGLRLIDRIVHELKSKRNIERRTGGRAYARDDVSKCRPAEAAMS